MKKIKIYTDSACDLEPGYLDELGAKMIPLTVHLGEENYFDRVNIKPQEFYEKLKSFSGQPKTSQVNPVGFLEEFKKGIDEGYHVICICFSSKLSGTYQSAVIAKDDLGSTDIDVIDSRGASVGHGLIVREAALMAKSGSSREEILDRVKIMSETMQYIFAVGSLEMLKRGGRISTTQAMIGGLLNVKPILQFEDGGIVPYDKVRGEKGIIKKLIETMKERGENLENQTVGISYSGSNALAEELRNHIIENFGVKDFLMSEIGAVIGSHVGAGTLALFFMKK